MSSKTCRLCHVDKPTSQFRPDPRYRDGFGSWCTSCHRERNSSWAKENRARLNEKARVWRLENIDIARSSNRKHKTANKARLAVAHADWAAANKDKRRAVVAAYKAAKLRATPSWASRSAIAAIYRAAIEAQKETGVRMHVDHIVPLQHPAVCGLHCEANLQILPGSENESKRNFWWPDMPDAYRQPRLFKDEPPKPKQEALL